jgi:hypothetical protein
MADQNRGTDGTDESARKANKSNDRDRNPDSMGEKDDVAEDRNLSGASTWLNLPDQPKDDDSSDDSDENTDRTSKR